MRTPATTRPAWCAGVAALSLVLAGVAGASSIPMPDGARSWILVQSSDCDDDGPNANVDRGHCIGEVSELNQAGDLGHGQIQNAFELYAGASIGPETMRGWVQTTAAQFGGVSMSMIDTYTLTSATLPAGTVVPITVSFHAVGTLFPDFVCCGVYGSGAFDIKIGNSFNPAPIVIPENTRVNSGLGPNASAAIPFLYPRPTGDPVPIDLLATHTMDVAIGTPFDLAYYLGAQAIDSRIDFTNTATIGFTVPEGTRMTSTGGFGAPVPVTRDTWSGLKTRHYR